MFVGGRGKSTNESTPLYVAEGPNCPKQTKELDRLRGNEKKANIHAIARDFPHGPEVQVRQKVIDEVGVWCFAPHLTRRLQVGHFVDLSLLDYPRIRLINS